jgi:hypothetical protein
MAKPIFITATERPTEKPVNLGNDLLSVKEVSTLSSGIKQVLESKTGIAIKSDLDLIKAKIAVLKGVNKDPVTAIGTDETSVIQVSDQEAVETLEELEKQLALGEANKEACPDLGFDCGWFDASGLLKKINLKKYAKSAADSLKSVFDMAKSWGASAKKTASDLFGTVISCTKYLASQTIKGINKLSKNIAKFGNLDMLKQLSDAINKNTKTDPSSFFDVSKLFGDTVKNSDTKSLSLTSIYAALTSLAIKPKALLSPFDKLISSFSSTKKSKHKSPSKRNVVSTAKIGSMTAPNTTTNGMNETFTTFTETSVDENRSNIINEAIASYDETFGTGPLTVTMNADNEINSIANEDGIIIAYLNGNDVWVYTVDSNGNPYTLDNNGKPVVLYDANGVIIPPPEPVEVYNENGLLITPSPTTSVIKGFDVAGNPISVPALVPISGFNSDGDPIVGYTNGSLPPLLEVDINGSPKSLTTDPVTGETIPGPVTGINVVNGVLPSPGATGVTMDSLNMAASTSVFIANGNIPALVVDKTVESVIKQDPKVLDNGGSEVPIVSVIKNNTVGNNAAKIAKLASKDHFTQLIESNDPVSVDTYKEELVAKQDANNWYIGENTRPVEKVTVIDPNELLVSLQVTDRRRSMSLQGLSATERSIAINRHFKNEYTKVHNTFK